MRSHVWLIAAASLFVFGCKTSSNSASLKDQRGLDDQFLQNFATGVNPLEFGAPNIKIITNGAGNLVIQFRGETTSTAFETIKAAAAAAQIDLQPQCVQDTGAENPDTGLPDPNAQVCAVILGPDMAKEEFEGLTFTQPDLEKQLREIITSSQDHQSRVVSENEILMQHRNTGFPGGGRIVVVTRNIFRSLASSTATASYLMCSNPSYDERELSSLKGCHLSLSMTRLPPERQQGNRFRVRDTEDPNCDQEAIQNFLALSIPGNERSLSIYKIAGGAPLLTSHALDQVKKNSDYFHPTLGSVDLYGPDADHITCASLPADNNLEDGIQLQCVNAVDRRVNISHTSQSRLTLKSCNYFDPNR